MDGVVDIFLLVLVVDGWRGVLDFHFGSESMLYGCANAV